MNILLTNDDGFSAPGITVLRERLLADGHNVYMCAPSGNRSGASHSINLGNDVEVKKIDDKTYTCSGSPADCVMTAIKADLFKDLDIVLSGINQGPNIGIDIMYSGTCGAARQATYYGIPSAALSVMVKEVDGEPFTPENIYKYKAMADFAAKNLDNFKKLCVVANGMSMPKEPCCFVNVNGISTDEPYKEARFTGVSFREYANDKITLVPKCNDVFERRFSGGPVVSAAREYSDWDAVNEGYVAVSRVFAEPMGNVALDGIKFIV